MFKKDKVVQRYIIILNAKSSKFNIGIKCWLDIWERKTASQLLQLWISLGWPLLTLMASHAPDVRLHFVGDNTLR